MRIAFLNSLRQISWSLDRLFGHFIKPHNVLRICRRRTEFISIIAEATRGTRPWGADLVDRVIQHILEEGSSNLSVYKTATTNPLGHDHALGVIAEGIIQKDFQRNAKNRKGGCTRGTLLIPTSLLSKNVHFQFTPNNNLNFFPANNRHYDVAVCDPRELAAIILDAIHERAIHWVLLGNENGSYRVQAAIAYSFCVFSFGNLSYANPPSRWQHGKDLTSADQIEILSHLAKVSILDSPLQ